jgi:hypothetical protein
MQQLEIQYFFPLTEQVPLDLDFKPCTDYEERKRKERLADSVVSLTSYGMLVSNGGTTWATVSNNLGNPSFTINVDQTPITIVSKKKPNFIKQFIYKSLGMKWKSE